MDIKDYVNHNYCFDGKYEEIDSYEEAKKIVEKENSISCLIINPKNNDENINYEIIECKDKICIDRSTIVFDNIIKYIKMFNIDIKKTVYLFHYKENACTKKNFKYKLLASSRKIGHNNIILYPTVFLCKSEIIKSPHYHIDARFIQNNGFKDIKWRDKKNIFFFRGINSGNPFYNAKYKWNIERVSRSKLILEYLKLPEKYKKMCDISFDRLCQNKETLQDFINDKITYNDLSKNNWVLDNNKTDDDLKEEIKIIIENMSNHINLSDILGNKYLFCLEGFDVSSLLNIVLCTNSLAIVPKMYYENTNINSSYLKPYIHYVPIKEDFSDLKEVIEWCLNNNEKCEEIIKNANEYGKIFLNENNMLEFLKCLIEKIIK